MPEYRYQRLDKSGRLLRAAPIIANHDTDDAALVHAQAIRCGHAVTVWSGFRKVAFIPEDEFA